ncbi:transposase [Ferrovum myxofaciens]|uniref:transposase n=1 Tax=Ferrovum myxofaciens TaxID=416213 RepID=UPI003B59AEEA
MYDLITHSAWGNRQQPFSQNDKKLRGITGAVTVLHTHNRRLDYHPHVRLVMPAAAFDKKRRLWRSRMKVSVQSPHWPVFRAKGAGEHQTKAGLRDCRGAYPTGEW